MISTLVNQTKTLICKAIGSEITTGETIRTENSNSVVDIDNLTVKPSGNLINNIMANISGDHFEVLQGNIFDCIRTIRDPEKPATLEDLQVVYESGVKVTNCSGSRTYVVDIEFNPTVPHCSLATLIGLCMRVKVERSLVEKVKLDIHIKKGAHDTEDEINKQINDKERVAAAMENPNLKEMVEKCITEDDL